MSWWQRWLQAPSTLGFRRVLFQIHLWLGIGLGLYVLMISLSGSAIVLRPQFSRWFIPSEVVSTALPELTGTALQARVAEVYSGYEVVNTVPSTRAGRATYVEIKIDGQEQSRFFDQFSGQDLGSTFPWPVATVEWLTHLHDELLMGRTGRGWNGWGGVLFIAMVISGLLIWWQGSRRWQDGLLIRRQSARSFNWQLHSFVGFWSLILMLAWGITAIYFAWPGPFEILIDLLDSDLNDAGRPDGWLLLLIDLHFGRFRGRLWANIIWIFLGLLPAVMYVTGFILWYQRVLRRWLKQDSAEFS